MIETQILKPFKLFDIPVSYQVNKKNLKEKYFQLQRLMQFGAKNGDSPNTSKQLQNLEHISLNDVNHAYQTLCNDVLRANLLCKIKDKNKVSINFEEQLRYGEEREEVIQANSKEKLEEFIKKTESIRDGYISEFDKYCQNKLNNISDIVDDPTAQGILSHINFYEQQLQQLKDLFYRDFI